MSDNEVTEKPEDSAISQDQKEHITEGNNESFENKEEIKNDDTPKSENEEAKNETQEPEENEDGVNALFHECFPDFTKELDGIPQENLDKFQTWMMNKMRKGFQRLNSSTEQKKAEVKEKLKSKYGDNHEEVKKNALSLLPGEMEINPDKEFDTIEKLYEVYQKLEKKFPIRAKTTKENHWRKDNPFLNSSHPDHKRVLAEYLRKIN